MFYSPSTFGFYHPSIHGDNIPVDAVEITIDEHAALLYGQSQGKRIVADQLGRPVLADPLPPTATVMIAAALARINAAYEGAVASMTAGYPEDEVRSWTKQETEAREWLKDPATATPWIDGAVLARGIAKADLVTKIIENANLFAPMHGELTGKRQKLRDQIGALGASPTQQQLDAIRW
ncbi:hypothetical protein [Nitrosovibrio sp. Nv4]|uniref:hypothetical protein n=1 Tax=Nitrosovibrio sp. Nv4 TaxID=1945880 RepID=UPI000BDC04E0|nr:hypothetical protein [Nitrosovibrio sp. Nv4]SOD42342.1 hypothetical protein SAMN06298226_2681 [Nitrosovibrio sp. Nv4]